MKRNYYFLFFFLLVISIDCFAQVQTRIVEPNSLSAIVGNEKNNSFKFMSILPINLEQVKKEDAYNRQKGLTERFGKSIPVSIGFEDGEWKIDEERGGYSWFLNLTSPKARGIIIHFDELDIPNGAELYAYNASKTMIYGPVTKNNCVLKNRFATDLISGDSITLQLFEPIRSRKLTKLHISSILYAYEDILQPAVDDSPAPLLNCHRDVTCAEGNGLEAETNATTFIFDTQGGSSCSGVLLNNACQNMTPTLLTARHCLVSGTDLNNYSFRFKFKKLSCDGSISSSWWSIMGATQSFISPKTNDVTTDALIVELSSKPSAYTGITYAGWSRTESNVTSITALHHPRRNPMKVSVAPPQTVSNINVGSPVIEYILAAPWRMAWGTNMTAQRGSSGGGCFDQNRRVIGQISAANFTSCDNRVAHAGRLATYWTEGANVFLSDDASVTQTNTVGIPNLNLPDCISGPTPLGLNWNGVTNMNLSGGSVQGVQGSYIPGQLAIEPIPNFSGSGFLEFKFKPSGITCNTPLTLRKDFEVGKPNPQAIFQQDGQCYAFLFVNNPASGTTYQWKVIRNGYTYFYYGQSIGFSNPSDYDVNINYELTASSACGSTIVEGSGVILACNGPLFQGNGSSNMSALKTKVYKPTLSISPNPATNEVTLNLKEINPMLVNTLCDVNIVNQMGQTVVSQKLIVENAIRLDISQLTNGFYVAQVKGENGLFLSQKLIVNRK